MENSGERIQDKAESNETFIVFSFSFDPSFTSGILTSIIEDLILPSSFADEYLASLPMVIGETELSLPSVRNGQLENELLSNHDPHSMTNPFSDCHESADYLARCERKCDPQRTPRVSILSPFRYARKHSSVPYATDSASVSLLFSVSSRCSILPSSLFFSSASTRHDESLLPSVGCLCEFSANVSLQPSNTLLSSLPARNVQQSRAIQLLLSSAAIDADVSAIHEQYQ